MPVNRIQNLLLKSKQNELHKRLIDNGYEPRDFLWTEAIGTEDPDQYVSRLTHHSSGSSFDFEPIDEEWVGTFSPAEWTAQDTVAAGHWESLLVHVDRWLGYLRRELDAPDLWSGLFGSGDDAETVAGPVSNEPFSEAERVAIVGRIGTLRIFLIDSGDRTEQDRHLIDERLSYLTDAVDRLGRRDWRGVAIGVVFDLAIAVLFEPVRARNIIDFLVGSARHLLPP